MYLCLKVLDFIHKRPQWELADKKVKEVLNIIDEQFITFSLYFE